MFGVHSLWVLMRVLCPSCAAEYEVPSTHLQPRRKVRCSRCGAVWVPVREAQAVAPDPAPVSPPAVSLPPPVAASAMDRLAAAAAAPPSMGLRAAWAASLVLLAGSAAATVVWRDRVEQVWPASAWVLGPVHRDPPAAPAPRPGPPPDTAPHAAGRSD